MNRTVVPFAFAVTLLAGSTSVAGGASSRRVAASRAPAAAAVPRALERRALVLADDGGPTALRVAGGVPTSLTFPLEVQRERVLLADTKGRFFEPQVAGRTLVLVPRVDLAADERVVLQVLLADGTLVLFVLATDARAADLAVDVALRPGARAPVGSVAALKASVTELQGRLDECQASEGEQGVAKVAALVLAQDPAKPEAFTVERQRVRALDKQARLLVEVRALYRLFDVSYLVVTLENRDPASAWVLDRAEVSVAGGAGEARVVGVVVELKVLRPGEQGRVVVAFGAPAREVGQGLSLKLFEKGGGRHVELPF